MALQRYGRGDRLLTMRGLCALAFGIAFLLPLTVTTNAMGAACGAYALVAGGLGLAQALAWRQPGTSATGEVFRFFADLVDGLLGIAGPERSWHQSWDCHWREHGDWWRGIVLQNLVGVLLGLGFLAGGLADVNIAWLAILWAVVMGGFEIVAGVHLRRALGTGRPLGAGGVALLLFALFAMIWASGSLLALRYGLGVALLFHGAAQVRVGLKLHAALETRGWLPSE